MRRHTLQLSPASISVFSEGGCCGVDSADSHVLRTGRSAAHGVLAGKTVLNEQVRFPDLLAMSCNALATPMSSAWDVFIIQAAESLQPPGCKQPLAANSRLRAIC